MIEVQPHPEGVVLAVQAQPGARRSEIRGEHAAALKVSVTQIAEKGKANRALCHLLARKLGLNRSQVELLTGETQSRKRFLLRGLTAPELRTTADRSAVCDRLTACDCPPTARFGCHRCVRCENRQNALTCRVTGAVPMLSLIPGERKVRWTMTVLELRGHGVPRMPRASLAGKNGTTMVFTDRPIRFCQSMGLQPRTECRVK